MRTLLGKVLVRTNNKPGKIFYRSKKSKKLLVPNGTKWARAGSGGSFPARPAPWSEKAVTLRKGILQGRSHET